MKPLVRRNRGLRVANAAALVRMSLVPVVRSYSWAGALKRSFLTRAVRLASVLALILSPMVAQTTASAATTWDVGDVFVGIGNGQYRVYSNAGVLKETISTGFAGRDTTGCAFNPARDKLYTTVFGGPVVVFSDAMPHSIVQTIDTSTTGAIDNESVVFAANGDFYIGHADGNAQIQRYNPAGVLQQSYNVARGPRGSDWIDLAADQKTMFYDSEGQIVRRFDVSGAGAQLADFATIPGAGNGFALRLLPPFDGSGGALVADGNAVVRLNGAGAVVQTYSFPGGAGLLFALNLDPNGTSFWTGDIFGAKFARLNIATGAVEVGPIITGASEVAGLCVKGEITGGAGDTTPPTCTLTAVIAGPPSQLQITVQDSDGGLGSTVVTTSNNATTVVPAFAVGTKDPVMVTATKIDETQAAELALRVTDLAGNVTNCDPVLTTLALTTGRRVRQTFTDIPHAEHFVTIQNGTRGLKRLEIQVNGKLFRADNLRNGQARTIDVGSAMRAGKNTVTLIGHGTPGDSAVVMIADTGGAASGPRSFAVASADSQRLAHSGGWGHVAEHREDADD